MPAKDSKPSAGKAGKAPPAPCDPQKLCKGEQKMYAWPPMFLLPPGYVPPGPAGVAAMKAAQPCKLTKDDLSCGPEDVDCRNNYVLNRQWGAVGGGNGCCDLIPSLRLAHLRTVRLQILRGEVEQLDQIGGAVPPHPHARPYHVKLVPLEGGGHGGQNAAHLAYDRDQLPPQ